VAGDAGGDDDRDDDVDVVDVVPACDAAPCVAASATPVAPAPMPAARNAVRIKRRTRPFEVDTIYPSFPLAVLQQATPARCRQHAWPDPAASRGAALSGL
jgi:hypothetical protein